MAFSCVMYNQSATWHDDLVLMLYYVHSSLWIYPTVLPVIITATALYSNATLIVCVHACVCMQRCVSVYVSVCACACRVVHAHVCACRGVCVCMYMCVHAEVCVCVCMCVCVLCCINMYCQSFLE